MSKLSKESVIEIWGEAFASLADNKRIEITEDEIILNLRRPIVTEEGEIKSVTLREPNLSDLKTIDGAKGDIAKAAALFSQCSGILPVYADKITGRDFIAAQQIISAFLADGPATGEK